MNEIDVLQEVFGPDEIPSPRAHDRARAALLERMSSTPAPAPRRRRPRWALRLTAAVTAAAAATVAVVAVENLNTSPGTVAQGPVTVEPVVPQLPFAKPAAAAEVLENAAFSARQRPWVTPRDDQFAYVERTQVQNDESIPPNSALVDGRTSVVRQESWVRIDGGVRANRTNGGEVKVTDGAVQFQDDPYELLASLTTPDRIDRFLTEPRDVGWFDPGMMIMHEVLPPDVEAAVYQWYARQPGAEIDPQTVNLDGRPAIAVTMTSKGWLSDQLLFDPETYQLIGMRSAVVKNHRSSGLDGSRRFRKGDVLNLEIRVRAGIVDRAGDTV